jgi:hypothetical protein
MISKESQPHFMMMLSSFPSLRSLKLRGSRPSIIPSGYVWPSSLESIAFNRLFDDQCSLIHRMVKGDIAIPPNLTELQMDISYDWSTHSAIPLALHHLPHLRSLRLPRCYVKDPSSLPPATQLTSLTLLDLPVLIIL